MSAGFTSNDDSSSDDLLSSGSETSIDEDEPTPSFSPITSSDSDLETEEELEPRLDQSQMDNMELESTTTTSRSSGDGAIQNSRSTLLSFKIVGDNVDKNVRPRYIRSDERVKSLHYYHCFAVLDRIDVGHLMGEMSPSCLPSHAFRAKTLLPNASDDAALVNNIKILFSRILADTLPFFSTMFSDLILKHIRHRRYTEMSSKSCIVSIIILIILKYIENCIT